MIFFNISWYEILGTLAYVLNFLVILNLIFREKRSSETTIAWILILTTIPIFGLIMYLSFGRGISKDNLFKVKENEDKIIKDSILNRYNELRLNDDSNLNIEEHLDMIYSLNTSNYANFTTRNKLELYDNGDDFFDNLLNELKNAQYYIHIQFYIFKDDAIGNKVLDILIDKAQKGVEVRLLYDAVGSRLLTDKTLLRLKNSGVKTGSFFPSFMKIINFNLNYRNHRKIVVIDGKTGFIGGNNVGDEYLGKDPKFGSWRDTHLKLNGDSVMDLNIRFLLDWRYTTKEDLDLNMYFNENCSYCTLNPSHYNIPIQIVSSGPDLPDMNEIKFGYVKMIQKAKKYIYIQSPYFILDKTLIDTLKIACFSGVDVKIMIPSKPDHPFVYWASLSYAGELLKYGAKLYNYDENGFLHAKTLVIDDSICSIGTANMDIRSFDLNFEVNAFVYSEEVAKHQKSIFENDMLKSKEITLDMYNSRLTRTKIKQSISRLLSPVL